MVYGMVCPGTDGNWTDIVGTGCDYNSERLLLLVTQEEKNV